MKKEKYKKKFWLAIKHAFFGHPKVDCTPVGAIQVKCKCGMYISLADYY